MHTYIYAPSDTMLELEEAMYNSEDYFTHARPYSVYPQLFNDWTMAEYIEAANVPVDDHYDPNPQPEDDDYPF